MIRTLGLILAGMTAVSVTAAAAPAMQRIRGTIASVSGDTMVVQPYPGAGGGDKTITLTGKTGFSAIVPSSLSAVKPGTFIGTAAKGQGSSMEALEVVVFPESLRGTGEGSYPWDVLPDTTKTGGPKPVVHSSMTNGTVATSGPAIVPKVKSSMTNGNIAAAATKSGGQELTVTYKGGEQHILLPPNVPIVTIAPGDRAMAIPGAKVFVVAADQDGKLVARRVAIGKNGLRPPM